MVRGRKIKTFWIDMEVKQHSVSQWHSQKAEKAMYIKGRLLDQAVFLFNFVPFQNGNFS